MVTGKIQVLFLVKGTIIKESVKIKKYIEKANFEDTGFSYTQSLISGKHKMVILYCLMGFEVVRFNELKRYIKNVSDKTLSSNLKELEKNRLIIRKEYPQIPPKVEYSLSERGKSLINDVNLRRHYPYVLQIYPYVKPIRCSVMSRYPFEVPVWTND